jgi:hypothetical protein
MVNGGWGGWQPGRARSASHATMTTRMGWGQPTLHQLAGATQHGSQLRTRHASGQRSYNGFGGGWEGERSTKVDFTKRSQVQNRHLLQHESIRGIWYIKRMASFHQKRPKDGFVSVENSPNPRSIICPAPLKFLLEREADLVTAAVAVANLTLAE